MTTDRSIATDSTGPPVTSSDRYSTGNESAVTSQVNGAELVMENNGYPPFTEPHCTRVRRRVARSPKRCSETALWEGHPIGPGDVYLEWTEFPGGESGYADHAGHPVRMAECADCARRYGRAALLDSLARATAPDAPSRSVGKP